MKSSGGGLRQRFEVDVHITPKEGLPENVISAVPRLAVSPAMTSSYYPGMQERRQNVRVRPAPDYEVKIDFSDGPIKVQCSIMDVAVGGVALVVDELFAHVKSGEQMSLGVTLPGFDRFETSACLRYTQGKPGGRCGIHFNKLTEVQQTALSRAVSELLERGHSV